jgi:hypothetical protein
VFLLPHAVVMSVEKVWKNGKWHMKLRMRYGEKQITCMFWWLWNECESIRLWMVCTIAGKLKKDDFNGGVYIVWDDRKVEQELLQEND